VSAPPVSHHFECQVGSQAGVPMSLDYCGHEVCITVAKHLVWTVSRGLLAESLVSSVRLCDDTVFGAHVVDDLVVMDLALGLPLHLVMELADVEEFLDATYAVDPEPVDPAELSVAMVGAL
jgi:hypothetical protein